MFVDNYLIYIIVETYQSKDPFSNYKHSLITYLHHFQYQHKIIYNNQLIYLNPYDVDIYFNYHYPDSFKLML